MEFASMYDDLDKGKIVDEYRNYSAVIGKEVEYLSGDEVINAVVRDISNDGGIVLETEGSVRTYRDGEIRIRLKDM
jgi:BirA family biotin operon repressor/biotin-[acetyl-CoA-carboxylase] ligase